MRSLPYKNVISSLSIYNKTQVLTATILKARLDGTTPELSLQKKGTVKIEFLTCMDHPTIPNRRKLIIDSKIETYINENTVFEILANKKTVLEYQNYLQENVRFEVSKDGIEWNIQRKEDRRTVLLNSADKNALDRLLEVLDI